MLKILESLTNNPVEETLENVAESSNYFVRWWNSIDWSDVLSEILTRGIYILIVLLIFFLLNKLLKTVLKRTFLSNKKRMIGSINRRNTVYKMIDNAISYLMVFFVAYSVLSIIGIPISTLLAGAGIAGIAIGLGAQSFISDIVNGFFILLENQVDVGDSVIIGDVSGNVVSVGLRSTQIQDFDGTLHFLPNHTIDVISNKSRNNMRAMIDITFYPDTDFSLVNQLIEQVNERKVPKHPEIVQGPIYFGPASLGNGLVSYKVIFHTLNGQQFGVQHQFLAEYLHAFQEAGIALPKTPFLQV